MALAPSDVLAVELLQKEAHLPAPLRVVPLFETMEALARGGNDPGATCWRCRGIARGAADGRK